MGPVTKQCIAIVSLAISAALCCGGASLGENVRSAVFVDNGQPLLVDDSFFIGRTRAGDGFWEIRNATFEDFPQYTQHSICIGVYASLVLGEGDYHIRARLGLVREDPEHHPLTLSAKVGSHYYDLEFSHEGVNLTGLQLDAVRYEPIETTAPVKVPLSGRPFTLEFVRRGNQVTTLVNGVVLHQIPSLEPCTGDIGLTIERPQLLRVTSYIDPLTTLRIYEWAARGNLYEKSPEQVKWENMVPPSLRKLKRIGNALAYVQDDPDLPRVLLVGDSISLYYTDPVRRLLAGKANVHRPPVGPGKLAHTMDRISEWLVTEDWDIIHFNFGLHELARKKGTPDDLAEYREGLETVVKRLEKTGAQLIWASTTPVPAGAARVGTLKGVEVKYNAVAEEIMDKHGIPIDDLYSAILPYHEKFWLGPNNIHFNRKGSAFLGEQVARKIIEVLQTLEGESNRDG